MPHAPQLFTSVWRSRQTPPQSVVPVTHDTVQVPREQTVPEGHTLPQVPQLPTSVARSRQVPEQFVVPSMQDTWQRPAEHT